MQPLRKSDSVDDFEQESRHLASDNLERARQIVLEKRKIAKEEYIQILSSSQKAIESSHMILNLQSLAVAGDVPAVDDDFARSIYDSRQELEEAIANRDNTKIDDLHRKLFELTERKDPSYVEKEKAMKQAREFKIARAHAPLWASHPTTRLLQFIRGDRYGVSVVSDKDRREFASRLAWTFALSGLLIALAFSVIDFWKSQKHPVLRRDLYLRPEIELPRLTLCPSFPHIPSFQGIDAENFKGYAIHGITSFQNDELNRTSETVESLQEIFEPVVLGSPGCNTSTMLMTVNAMRAENGSSRSTISNCFSCYRTRADKSFVLHRSLSGALSAPPVKLRLAISRLQGYCFGNDGKSNNAFLRDMLTESLLSNANVLEKNGVLSAEVGSITFGLNFGLPTGSTPDEIQETASFLCNVYFFSGVFFPKEQPLDVRYSLSGNGITMKWQKTGNGPYHFVSYNGKLLTDSNDDHSNLSPTAADSRDQIFSPFFHVFLDEKTNSSGPTLKDRVATISQDDSILLTIARIEDGGTPSFRSSQLSNSRKLPRLYAAADLFDLSLQLESFYVEVLQYRAATSVEEFVTDVFEYIGLFTGVCVYAVLVAPAKAYLKRTKKQ